MSLALIQEVKTLREQVDALKSLVEDLAMRVYHLESVPLPTMEVDIDTLQPKKRGRPPKVAQ